MPVISPRRSSTSASGSIYGTSSSSATTASSDSSSRIATDRIGSSGYKSYLDRAGSLSKLTTSSSSYSPSLSNYLGSSSYSSYTPRSSTTYRSSASSLTGGSSGVGTYRSILPSLGSSSSYDTTTLSRYGVKKRGNALDTYKTDYNSRDNAASRKPPSGSDSGGGSRDSKRLSGSSSSSSLALLVATSGHDMYEKYSPANYKPNTELSGSRSALNEAASNDVEDRGRTMTTGITTPTADDIILERSRNRYSRLYSRHDTDETDNVSSVIRSNSGTRPSGYLSASNSTTTLNSSASTDDVPTITLSRTRLRRSKPSDEKESKKSNLRNGTSEYDTKSSSQDRPLITSNGLDAVVHIKLNKLKVTDHSANNGIHHFNTNNSEDDKAEEASTTTTNSAADLQEDSESLNKQRPSAAQPAASTNGMRRSGNGTHLGTTTAVATALNKVEINYSGPQFKGLSSSSGSTSVSTAPSAAKKLNSTYTTSVANSTAYASNKLNIRNQVKPLVHRSTAAANSSTPAPHAHIHTQNKNNNNNGSNNSLNNIAANSGNNNMQTSLDQDDIKFIDSDEPPPTSHPTATMTTERKSQNAAAVCDQRCCLNQQHHVPVSSKTTRIRPKSTIICSSSHTSVSSPASSTNSMIFEKVNNYKYANGSLGSGLSSSSLTPSTTDKRTETAIDSNSIRESIEKFNTFSEQKRLPLSSVTLRSHSGSGSTSNLQHHRHSTDLDNCNLRLPNSGGGSLTRSPYRSSGTTGKVITSLYPSASAAVSYVSSRHTVLSNNPSSTGSLPLKGSKHYAQAEDTTFTGGLSSSVDGDVSKKKLVSITGGLSESTVTDETTVRSSAALRSALPPASPTSSRYWDRESSRSSLISSSTSHNNTDENKKSSTNDEETEGLCGLRNIGNTCFMNSVIQCLSHTNELTKYLRNYNATKSPTSKDQQILYEFSKLIKEMWTNNVHSVTPMELKRSFSAKHRMYSDYNQQDAQEFLRFFLDSLHCALNSGAKGEHLKIDDNLSDNKKAELTWEWYSRLENSLIRDLFVGQLKSTLRCTNCGNTSVTFDPFWDLSVSLPSSSRCKLESCLDLFIREEVLDGDEMPTCAKCQTRRKCTKSFAIQRFPKYLVIHLKRFSETRWSKLSNIVEFPTGERELNMGPYGANANSNMYFSLYAISNHMGSTAGGHYVAVCKHPVSKKWHEFNDNLVSDSLSDHHLVSSSAYILFYERA